MFDFLLAAPFEDRKVARHKAGDLIVSTVSMNDGRKPYETAVCHPDYNDNKWVIVDCYDTREEARLGHEHWIAVMSQEELPDELIDVANSKIQQFLAGTVVFKRKSK